MRPILVYAPKGPVPAPLVEPLAALGAEVLVASGAGEAVTILERNAPALVLVIPPAQASDAAPLLGFVSRLASPPPILVLGEGETSNPVALEVVGAESWRRATEDLLSAAGGAAGGAASALLLSRAQLATLLDLWERSQAPPKGFMNHLMRSLAQGLNATRLSLFAWSEGEPFARLIGSSMGRQAIGRQLDISRYPELKAAAGKPSPVLVEEISRDPLMKNATRYLDGAKVKSVICQQVPGEGEALFLHAMSEKLPFGLGDVALLRVATRLVRVAAAAPRQSETQMPAAESRPVIAAGPTSVVLGSHDFIRALPLAAALLSKSGEIVAANKSFLALTGRDSSDLTGLDYRWLFRPPRPEDGEPVASSSGFDVQRARLGNAAGDTIPVELTLPADPDASIRVLLMSRLPAAPTLPAELAPAPRAKRPSGVFAAPLAKPLEEASEPAPPLEPRPSKRPSGIFAAPIPKPLEPPAPVAAATPAVAPVELEKKPDAKAIKSVSTKSSSIRLNRLLGDLLPATTKEPRKEVVSRDLSKDLHRSPEISKPAPEPRSESVDLPATLNAVYAAVSDLAGKSGVQLHLDCPNDLPTVRADRSRLMKLLTALAENSLKASPKRTPHVLIKATDEDELPAVYIYDSGPSLSEAESANLLTFSGLTKLAAEAGVQLAATIDVDGSNVTCVTLPRD